MRQKRITFVILICRISAFLYGEPDLASDIAELDESAEKNRKMMVGPRIFFLCRHGLIEWFLLVS